MNHRILPLLAAGLLLGGCAAERDADAEVPGETTAVVDDEAALAELADYWVTHHNMGHAQMVADKYTADAMFMPASGEVLSGADAVSAYLAEGIEAMSPEVSVDQVETRVIGDWAIARGTYEMAGEADGEPVRFSGAYLIVAERDADGWKIARHVGNYDSGELVSAMWNGPGDDFEAPPAEGTLTSLADEYTTHYNLGHASMVADYFTEDAWAAFSGSPWITGREAIAEAVEASMEGGPQLTVHDLETIELGDGLVADAGWYELHVDGERVQAGNYGMVAEMNAEGEPRIKWFVGTASPTG